MNRALRGYTRGIIGGNKAEGRRIIVHADPVVLEDQGRSIPLRFCTTRRLYFHSSPGTTALAYRESYKNGSPVCLTLRKQRPDHNNRRNSFSSSSDSAKTKSSNLQAVQVTKTSTKSNGSALPYDLEKEDLTAFIDDLLRKTRELMDKENSDELLLPTNGTAMGTNTPSASLGGSSSSSNSTNNKRRKGRNAHHVIAFSGGIDSSVAAALIHRVASSSSFSDSLLSSGVYHHETVTAVLGLSPAVPMDQRKLAEEVASTIGVTLEQVSTTEGTDEVYVANDGRACLACKTHLYDNLRSISEKYRNSTPTATTSSTTKTIMDTILYNGTNADDLKDPTRLGLIAAHEFHVRSPLAGLGKARVRAIGKHLGLPNWDYAASPCLRSRLAVGVLATSDRLRDVGAAEAFVRESVGRSQPGGVWDVRRSLRVRILSKNRAMIEVDDDAILQTIEKELSKNKHTPSSSSYKSYFEDDLGFAAVGVRKFKTGSVAPAVPPTTKDRIATIASPTGGEARKLRRRP